MVTAADFAELTAADNSFDDFGDPKIIFCELSLDLVEQGPVAQEHAATEGVAEKLARELAHEIISAVVEKIITQPVDAGEPSPIEKLRARVDRQVGTVFQAKTPDGVVILQGKTQRDRSVHGSAHNWDR